MKALSSLLSFKPENLLGNTEKPIACLVIDSRKVGADTLFVAMRGTQTDGHVYIPKAIELGATAILCEELPTETLPHVSYIVVNDTTKALGIMAANFYDNPSEKLKLIGVTGTNGKTTNVTLLFRLFRRLGYRCGLVSTVQNQIEDQVIPSTHTTPDVVSLNALLAQMVQAGCSHAFMEVSSHAVVQGRIAGVNFVGGIFTNITHDHLDFHKTFENYIKAKKGFFDALPKTAFALVNADDKRSGVMLQNTKGKRCTFSLKSVADFNARIISDSLHGLHVEMGGREVWFKLIGTFNAYNLLGVYGAAVLLGENPEEVLMQLSDLQTAPGRFDQVVSPTGIVGIIDYAHTPDALENVLQTIQSLRQGHERVITVVGCGGDRDATKRPLMANIASQLSDIVILSSDNPRGEDPHEILAQMQKGIEITHARKVRMIENRHEAIATAISLAQPEDVVLIAGKGHENYQEIKGVKYHFDDKEEVLKAFNLLQKA